MLFLLLNNRMSPDLVFLQVVLVEELSIFPILNFMHFLSYARSSPSLRFRKIGLNVRETGISKIIFLSVSKFLEKSGWAILASELVFGFTNL